MLQDNNHQELALQILMLVSTGDLHLVTTLHVLNFPPDYFSSILNFGPHDFSLVLNFGQIFFQPAYFLPRLYLRHPEHLKNCMVRDLLWKKINQS